ncbi:MAG: cytochrome c [Thermoanaerobaculia bacterium]|nr:MAG: cytochrome c [Thermoanaerobaculia bacterium]
MHRTESPRPGPGALSGVLLLIAASLVCAAAAGRAEEEPAYSAFNGKQSYKTLCMNCHGVEGKGDGYLVENLRVRPTDLTVLAQKNGGVYPADRVRASIDGREQVTGHGLREMPVWGDVLVWTEQDSAERQLQIQRKIGELVEFIRSIQVGAEKQP